MPSNASHNIGGADTCWIFLSDSVDPRHLFDIVFAEQVLKRRGVPSGNVLVFTADPGLANQHLQAYGLAADDLSTLDHRLRQLQCTTAVVTVGGHGTLTGIGTSVSPAGLLGAMRAIPSLKAGLLVLCQCFGGAFNLLRATASPPLAIVGATNLQPSISSPMTTKVPLQLASGGNGQQGWSANLFMVQFFAFLESPTDVDGDGRLTVLDAYKFAGATSNEILTRIKGQLFIDAIQLAAQLAQGQTVGWPLLQLGALRTKLNQTLGLLHMHQDPWILNADLARRLLF